MFGEPTIDKEIAKLPPSPAEHQIGFAILRARQNEGDWLSHALNAHMDLGAEAPLAPAECLGFWVPLFAPAACWWARMTVAST